MRPLRVLLLLACAFALLAGCGDSDEPTSCADVADRYAEATAGIVDQIGDRTDAQMESPPPDLETAADEWFATVTGLLPDIIELCDEAGGEFDRLLCDRAESIRPGGEAGRRFLEDNFPHCSG